MKYRLNDDVGGEWDAVAVHGGKVGFDFPGVEDRVWLPIDLLDEVLPPQPDEPEPGAYQIGDVIAVRLGHSGPIPGCEWFATSDILRPYRWSTWPDLWALAGTDDATVVPLRPDPHAGPVDLPWTAQGGQVIVKLMGDDWTIGITLPRDRTFLMPAEARDMARALWHAATRAEAGRKATDGTAAP